MEPLAPGMRRTGKILRHMPGAAIARATDAQIERTSGATVPELFASILQGKKPRGVTIEDRSADGVPVRIYRPTGASTGSATKAGSVPEPVEGPTITPVPEPVTPVPEPVTSVPEPVEGPTRPLILYFHGGGFVYGDLRGGDWLCGTVARELDAIVISVQYRLAPKHPFPAGPDDCYAALVWVAAHATELGADASKLGVMGESAGGNLAAVVALMARDNRGPVIRHQALLYPSVGGGDTASRRANAEAFILTAADIQKFGELYAGPNADWRVSPIKVKSLKGLPPAIIVVGGHDPLHDDGVLYADALRNAGVPVTLNEYPAMPHGFMNFPRFARDAKPALATVIASQRAVLRNDP